MIPHKKPDKDLVTEMTEDLLIYAGEVYPEAQVSEVLSAMLSGARSLICYALTVANDEHNRSEMLKALGQLEQEVWDHAPKTEIQ